MDAKQIFENVKKAALHGFNNYANFNGREDRPLFWHWVLFIFAVNIVLSIIAKPLAGLFILATLVPSLAFGARRLHDVNLTGWLQAALLVPLLGLLVLIYFWAQPSVKDGNRF